MTLPNGPYKDEVLRLAHLTLLAAAESDIDLNERKDWEGVKSFVHAQEVVHESLFCNEMEAVRLTIAQTDHLETADRMFPINEKEIDYYDTAGIVLIDMAFFMLLADVTDAVIERMKGATA